MNVDMSIAKRVGREIVSPRERQLLSVLRSSRTPLTADELVEKTGLKRRTVYEMLSRLRAAGAVEKTWRGYRIRDSRVELYDLLFFAYGLVCILASVPLGNSALAVAGSVAVVLGRVAVFLSSRR